MKMDIKINVPLTRKILTKFIHSEIARAGFSRAVIGLSGGIDSALSCYLAAEALGQEQRIRPSLQQLPAWMDQALKTAWSQADALLDIFLGVNPIYLLHRGVSKGAANCARLVIEEVARRPAVAMEAGEFRQGPIEVVDQDFGAMVYVVEGEAGQLNCRLAEDIRASGGRVYLVGHPGQPSRARRDGDIDDGDALLRLDARRVAAAIQQEVWLVRRRTASGGRRTVAYAGSAF